MQSWLKRLISRDLEKERQLYQMNGPQFFETSAGRRFYEHDIPEMVSSLIRIAISLESLVANNEQATTQAETPGERGKKIIPALHYANEIREAWENNFKRQGAVPYDEAKDVLNILTRLLRQI